jgi:hypothetical protein
MDGPLPHRGNRKKTSWKFPLSCAASPTDSPTNPTKIPDRKALSSESAFILF